MKYIVKTTYIAKPRHPFYKEGETRVWYVGKGQYAGHTPDEVEGWGRRHFAERFIRKSEEWDARFLYRRDACWNITREVLVY